MDTSVAETHASNKKRIEELLEENSLLKKNLSFTQEPEHSYLEAQILRLRQQVQAPVAAAPTGTKQAWEQSLASLGREYARNIEVLQREYVRAIRNATVGLLKLDPNSLGDPNSDSCIFDSQC